MVTDAAAVKPIAPPAFTGMPIVDCDFHNINGARIEKYLSPRWRDYAALVGQRNREPLLWGAYTQGRPGAFRRDTVPPSGGVPGSDVAFVREQLLDAYGVRASVINNLEYLTSGNAPVDLEVDVARATNDCNLQEWMAADQRFLASIIVTPDHPQAAVLEIERCTELSDRFIQTLMAASGERPYGNPKYWPVWEAAESHGVPVAVHPGQLRYHSRTGAGPHTYYFESFTAYPGAALTMISSMIFEGVFDRFPALRVVMVELGWDWVPAFGWRLDASWRVMREEVPHLGRKPSEYLRDHFWFTTQPQCETENPSDIMVVIDQCEEFGLGSRLLFSTDYPHWDMDSPFEVLPPTMSREAKRRILSENADALYGFGPQGDV